MNMTVRGRIILLAFITFAFIAAMIAVMLVTLRLTDDFVRRIDGVHRRFEVITELEAQANNYAEQIAEVLLLGSEQKPDFDAARAEMESAFRELIQVTRAEISTLQTDAETQRELSDVEMSARLMELYKAIDGAAETVFALNDSGKRAEAIAIFRTEVEYRLSNDLETLIEAAIRDERRDVAAAQADVRAMQNRLLIGAGIAAAVALLAGTGLGVGLHRSIIRPISDLNQGAKAIAEGNFEYRLASRGNDEFAGLSRDFNKMAEALSEQRNRIAVAQARLESEVAARTSELRDANARLRDLDIRRAQFLADVSHELRTPLTILRGEADVALRSRPNRGEDRATLSRIQRQAADMGHLLDQLLAFARSDAENQTFEPKVAAAEEIAIQAIQEGNALAVPRSIVIDSRLNAPNAMIKADSRMIKQALLIGLDNAIKYSRPRSRIVVAVQRSEQGVEISIDDEGEGIRPEDKPFVFERFYRGRADGGLGIGLAIAKAIVERHGGGISLDNREPRGARLTISLPLAPAEVA